MGPLVKVGLVGALGAGAVYGWRRLRGASTAPSAGPMGPPVPTPSSNAARKAEPVSTLGYEPMLAYTLAPKVDADLRAKAKNYDRVLMRQFQSAAGNLSVDGDYGQRTRGALIFYGVPVPPNNVFGDPTAVVPFAPPPAKPN